MKLTIEDYYKFNKFHKMELNQTSITSFFYCPMKYQLNNTLQRKVTLPGYFYLGSLMHKLIELRFKYGELTEDIVYSVHKELINTNSYEETNGDPWEKCFGPYSLIDMINFIYDYLKNLRMEILAIEKHISITIGEVEIHGTLDMLMRNPLGTYLVDFKSSGLSKKYFGRGSISRKHYSDEEITYSTQLNHYAWLLDEPPDYIGYILPVNLVPYTRGDKVSSLTAFVELDKDYMEVHGQSLYETAREIDRCITHGIWPRAMPQTYGKLDCVFCEYKDICLKGIKRVRLPYDT